MINIEGHTRLDRLTAELRVWIQEKLTERLDEKFSETQEFPTPVLKLISEASSRNLVAEMSRQTVCQFFASNSNGSTVELASELFLYGGPRLSYFQIRYTDFFVRKGDSGRRRLEFEEFLASDLWKDRVLEEAIEELERPQRNTPVVSYFKERILGKMHLPVPLDQVPIVNWKNGTIDLSERKAIAALNEKTFLLANQAVSLGVEPPKRLLARPARNLSEAHLNSLDGRIITLQDSDYASLTKLLRADGPTNGEKMSTVDLILDIFDREPSLGKGTIKSKHFPNLSVRKFNLYWSIAAEKNSKLSRPGRKSSR